MGMEEGTPLLFSQTDSYGARSLLTDDCCKRRDGSEIRSLYLFSFFCIFFFILEFYFSYFINSFAVAADGIFWLCEFGKYMCFIGVLRLMKECDTQQIRFLNQPEIFFGFFLFLFGFFFVICLQVNASWRFYEKAILQTESMVILSSVRIGLTFMLCLYSYCFLNYVEENKTKSKDIFDETLDLAIQSLKCNYLSCFIAIVLFCTSIFFWFNPSNIWLDCVCTIIILIIVLASLKTNLHILWNLRCSYYKLLHIVQGGQLRFVEEIEVGVAFRDCHTPQARLYPNIIGNHEIEAKRNATTTNTKEKVPVKTTKRKIFQP